MADASHPLDSMASLTTPVEEPKFHTHFGMKTLSEIKKGLKEGEMALSHFGDDVLNLLGKVVVEKGEE